APQPGAPPGVTVSAPPTVTVPAGGLVGLPVTLTVPPGTTAGDVTGFVVLTQGTRVRRIPYWAMVERPVLGTVQLHQLPKPGIYQGPTGGQRNGVTSSRSPADPSGSDLPSRFAGGEQLWHFHLGKRAFNAGVTIESKGGARVLPLLLSQRDENTVAGE